MKGEYCGRGNEELDSTERAEKTREKRKVTRQ